MPETRFPAEERPEKDGSFAKISESGRNPDWGMPEYGRGNTPVAISDGM